MHSEKFADAEKRKTTPASYLLNLYPTPGNKASVVLAGTVEKLGNDNDGKHAFHSVDELLQLLGIEDFKMGARKK